MDSRDADGHRFVQGQTLNPTERCFTLLEAYLYHASEEMIGHRGRWLDTPGLLSDCLMAWRRVGEQGLRIPPGKKQDRFIFGIGGF